MIPGAHDGQVVLDVQDLAVRVGGTSVLSSVSFTVVDRIREGCTTGQVVSILGPSGVGKTRLLRVLAGLDAPDGGTVTGSVTSAPVGMVFQDYPLLRHRTVRENLELGGTIGGLSRGEAAARANELLALVKLEARAEHYPHELSGGQRQRAAIAQQLAVPRRLLLLDEPFSGLDPKALAAVSELIVDAANMHQLNTVLLVTHDIRAALAVSDTVLLLGPGQRGGTVVGRWDLVELGVAWGVAGAQALTPIEREIAARF
jgi:ABC-type nitrate/sulfonate/bicarbonate transport system ATPase subunit